MSFSVLGSLLIGKHYFNVHYYTGLIDDICIYDRALTEEEIYHLYSCKADFSFTPQFGYLPLEVTFTDLSTGFPTTWEWDFDNDGIVDAYEQNPTHTYSNEGLYDVELKVSGSYGADFLLIEDCILVQSVELAPPTNPIIETSGNDIILSWDDVSVDYYLIYSNDKPDGVFTYLDNVSGVTTYTHTGTLLEKDKLFYVIIGFNGGLGRLERFINNNRRMKFNDKIK
ncbi:MAG: PKD domain-containing protein [Candidatus Cloacimonetes bacterium]|nr:PKD domain-containing protein [Candidatus Cloacimonadota bacterium]